MSSKIKVTFTRKEALTLDLVAGNGYGDGSFFDNDGTTGKQHKPGRDESAYIRAMEKLATALRNHTHRM